MASNLTLQWIRRKNRDPITSLGRMKGECVKGDRIISRDGFIHYLNCSSYSDLIFHRIIQITQFQFLRVGQFVYGILTGSIVQMDEERQWFLFSDGSGIIRIDITEARIDSIRASDYKCGEVMCGVLCVNQPPFTFQLVCILS